MSLLNFLKRSLSYMRVIIGFQLISFFKLQIKSFIKKYMHCTLSYIVAI